MTWLVALVIAMPGFAALCLSMKKCQRQIFETPVPDARSRSFRYIGFVAIAALSIWCMAAETWSTGLVVFFGVCTIASLIVIFTLAIRPRLVRYYCWHPV